MSMRGSAAENPEANPTLLAYSTVSEEISTLRIKRFIEPRNLVDWFWRQLVFAPVSLYRCFHLGRWFTEHDERFSRPSVTVDNGGDDFVCSSERDRLGDANIFDVLSQLADGTDRLDYCTLNFSYVGVEWFVVVKTVSRGCLQEGIGIHFGNELQVIP